MIMKGSAKRSRIENYQNLVMFLVSLTSSDVQPCSGDATIKICVNESIYNDDQKIADAIPTLKLKNDVMLTTAMD